MFGNLGQIASLLKNAGSIRENMKQMNERLRAARFQGEAGAGQVRATVDGRGELLSIKIEPSALADVELLEDLVVASVSDAVRRSREGAAKEMEAATGGVNIQAMLDSFGK